MDGDERSRGRGGRRHGDAQQRRRQRGRDDDDDSSHSSDNNDNNDDNDDNDDSVSINSKSNADVMFSVSVTSAAGLALAVQCVERIKAGERIKDVLFDLKYVCLYI